MGFDAPKPVPVTVTEPPGACAEGVKVIDPAPLVVGKITISIENTKKASESIVHNLVLFPIFFIPDCLSVKLANKKHSPIVSTKNC